MGALALVCAVLGLVTLVLAGVGKYAAIGLGLFAVACGIVGWRSWAGRAGARLAGATGVALGLLAVLLGTTEVTLTLIALDRFAQIFGP